MDVVIEGWHGYKPSDSHKSDMDYTHLNMSPATAAKFDKHVVSTRIRAGRSIDTVALPPATDRKQRRLVWHRDPAMLFSFNTILLISYCLLILFSYTITLF
jgi:hypothetical protein